MCWFPPCLPHPMQAFGYRTTLVLLRLLVKERLLNPRAIRSVCDFGAGVGGPTLATRHFFRVEDSRLTLLESDPLQLKILRRLFPQSSVLAGDGLAFLASIRNPFDLITAYMFGPDYDGDGSAMAFLEAALSALSPQGALLITSDTATLHTVQKALGAFPEVDGYWFLPTSKQCLPISVIISRAPFPERKDTRSVHLSRTVLPAPVLRSLPLPEEASPEISFPSLVETFPLSNHFERAYLHATIQAFETFKPGHPAISAMRELQEGGIP